jgi:acyl carrier protein
MELKEIKDKLKTFICKELLNNPTYPLQDEEPLITSGLMDSFSLAQIGVFTEIQFNVYIPDSDLTVDAMNTVNQMAARIQKDLPA